MAPQVKKGLKDSPTAAGNGGTFFVNQCEDLEPLPVEIDDTPDATWGTSWCQQPGPQVRYEGIPYALCPVRGDSSRRRVPPRTGAHNNK